jgi:hypothetical protein
MIVFFAIALSIYSLVNIYLFYKGSQSVPFLHNNKLIYAISFFVLAGLFIFAKILESKHSSVITDALNIIGGFWLAFMLYGFLFFLLSDIVLLILRIPGIVKGDSVLIFRKWSFIIIMSASALLIIGGFINAIIPYTREYNLTINKSAGQDRKSVV